MGNSVKSCCHNEKTNKVDLLETLGQKLSNDLEKEDMVATPSLQSSIIFSEDLSNLSKESEDTKIKNVTEFKEKDYRRWKHW